MKCSLFYELQIESPDPQSEQRAFMEAVEQIELADRLGYHAVWAVEHHGLYEYSHSSAPEVLLSYAAARTRQIRLGHGVTLLPHQYNHPIRVAERVATLDILSRGRVNFGTGKSSSPVEQRAFGMNPNTLNAQWEESLRAIAGMWRNETFEFDGEFVQVPPTRVVPRPLQAPHPPMFMACSRPESARRAGEHGLGALNFASGTDAELRDTIRQYRTALETSTPIGAQRNNHFACTPAAIVLPNDKEACEWGYRGARFFGDALGAYYGAEPPSQPIEVRRDALTEAELNKAMVRRNAGLDQNNVLCGDPGYAREYVERFREIGVDELIFVMQMGTVPHEIVRRSVLTFGEQVLPHVS